MPWYAKAAAAAIAAYALSPIDLIPDFIPVLGYLDEVILLPIAISLVIKMIPIRSWRSSAKRRRGDPSARPAAWRQRRSSLFGLRPQGSSSGRCGPPQFHKGNSAKFAFRLLFYRDKTGGYVPGNRRSNRRRIFP